MVLSFCLLVLIMQIMLINLSVANVDWPSRATVLGAMSSRCAAGRQHHRCPKCLLLIKNVTPHPSCELYGGVHKRVTFVIYY